MRGKGLRTALAALSIAGAAVSPRPCEAQASIEVSGGGEPVPGGRIVRRGTELEVTIRIAAPGDYGRVVGQTGHGGRWFTEPETLTHTLTADSSRLDGLEPVVRLPITVDTSAPGARDPAYYRDRRLVASEDVWVFGDRAPRNYTLEVLGVSERGSARYRATIPTDAPRFLRLERVRRGVYATGHRAVDEIQVLERNIRPGTLEGETSPSPAGEWELRLVGEAVYGSVDFVSPERKPAPSTRGPRKRAVPLDLGITRTVRLPGGDAYQLGDPVDVEVTWRRKSADTPDVPKYYRKQRVFLVRPYERMEAPCVRGSDDVRDGVLLSLEPRGPDRWGITIDRKHLRTVGTYYVLAATPVNHNRETHGAVEDPLESIARFEVQAPDASGRLSWEWVDRGGPTRDGRIRVRLNGRLPPGLQGEARWQLYRPPARAAGGELFPGRSFSSDAFLEGHAREVTVPRDWSDYEMRLVVRYPCGLGTCDAILDSVRIPNEDVPDEVKRRLRLEDPRAAAVFPWPPLDAGVVLCEPDRAAPAPTEPVAYQPPPAIALDVAIHPRAPLPGDEITLAFRARNVGSVTAAATTVELTLLESARTKAPAGLQAFDPFCKPIGDGRFRCTLGDVPARGAADLAFAAVLPPTGTLLWSATIDSPGDLGGVTDPAGLLGTPAPPRIVDVVVIDDQHHVENDLPSYPYPAGGDRQMRRLLVVGHNLPQTSQKPIDVRDEPAVDYQLLAMPDTRNTIYREWMARGWKKFYGTADADTARSRAKEDGYDALLVTATLREGVLPGVRTIEINGTRAHWGLEFTGLSARTGFVRLLPDERWEWLTNAYLPERIAFAVETAVRLPVEEVLLRIEVPVPGGSPREVEVRARRTERAGGRLYLSGPLDLHVPGGRAPPAGGTTLPVAPDTRDPPVVRARVDETFAFESFRLALDPPVASLTVRRTPAAGRRSWLWKDALSRAAVCKDVEIEDWSALDTRESEEIWNVIVFTGGEHFPGESVKFGHHAGAILLRDMFLTAMERQAVRLRSIREDEGAVRAMIAHLSPRTVSSPLPILDVPVTDFGSGRTIRYRYAIMNDARWLAEQHDTSVEAIETWQVRATRSALDRMLEASAAAATTAREAGDCDVEALIELTGVGFDPIVRLLEPELVRLVEAGTGGERRTVWEADPIARAWVRGVGPFAETVRAQQRLASSDTDMVMIAVALAAAPIMLVEGTIVLVLDAAFEVAAFSISAVREISGYAASGRELSFALGASLAIGDDRHRAATENAKTLVGTALGIGAGAFPAGAAGVGVRQAARGRHVARGLERTSDLGALPRAELEELAAFAVVVQVRRAVHGEAALAETERFAIELLDDLREVARARTARLPEPDLPPEDLVDSAGFASTIRFVHDPGAATTVMLPGSRPLSGPLPDDGATAILPAPGSLPVDDGATAILPTLVHHPSGDVTKILPPPGAISAPRRSGDVPNAARARIPEGFEIRCHDEAGNPMTIRFGKQAAPGGSSSEFFEHPDDPRLGIRVTFRSQESPEATHYDLFGERAVEQLRSSRIRTVRKEGPEYTVAPGGSPFTEGPPITRIIVVERLRETAKEQLARQPGGRMTAAQREAYVAAHRDLNDAGLVWLDNKSNNFAFETDAAGRVQLVVIDPGGIMPILGTTGRSAAQNARRIQRMLNGRFADQFPHLDPRTPRLLRILEIRNALDEFCDLRALGVDGLEAFAFNPRSGEDFDYLADAFQSY